MTSAEYHMIVEEAERAHCAGEITIAEFSVVYMKALTEYVFPKTKKEQ